MTITQQDVTALWKELRSRVDAGDRFAGLFATHPEGGTLVLSAHVAAAGGIDTLERRMRCPGTSRATGSSRSRTARSAPA